MTDTHALGPWLRRFLEEHLVSERNLARNTQLSYRDTLALLLPHRRQGAHAGRPANGIKWGWRIVRLSYPLPRQDSVGHRLSDGAPTSHADECACTRRHKHLAGASKSII